MVLMRPGRKDEEASLAASLEILVARLAEGIESPWGKKDERQPGIECCPHHRLFALGYGGRDEHRPVSGLVEHPLYRCGYLLVCQSA